MPSPLATPIFGVIARTKSGRDHLSPEFLQPWVQRWISKPDPSSWWINAKEGIAIFKPDYTSEGDRPNESSCLCVRGTIIADGMREMPRQIPDSPPPTGLSILLNSIMERDTSTIRELRGQFAIACWDGRRRILWLSRDHLGQRCMYTRTDPNYILFCSELAPLLRSPVYSTELNEESIFWYLAFGNPPPGQTLAKDVRRVPAAHTLKWEPGQAITTQRYWTPLNAEAPHEVDSEYIRHTRQVLETSLLKRLNKEAAQGLFLSGGVDSTFLAVTAKMAGHNLESFISEFDEQYGINETEYAKGVADWLHFPLHVIPVRKEQALVNLDEVVLSAAEPCSAWAVLSHFSILAAAQQRKIKSMTSGLGADEIFGGYDHFRGYYSRYLRYVKSQTIPNGMDAFEAIMMPESQNARKVLYPGVARLFDDPSLRKALYEPYNNWQYASHLRSFYRECRNLKPEAQVMEMMVAHECQHRIPDLLHANFEPLSRRMGIDVSYPFLDPDVVSLACGLSVTSRYRTPSGDFSLRLRDLMPRFKYGMMQIASDRVPQAIIDRPRKSYTAPFGQWLFDPRFSNPLLSRMQKSKFWDRNIVKKEYVEEILKQVVPGPNPAVFKLWGLLTLIGWYDRFVEGNN